VPGVKNDCKKADPSDDVSLTLGARAFSRATGVPLYSVYKGIKDGTIPSLGVSRTVRIPRSFLEKLGAMD
jgi:hypothetical protein